MTVHQPVVPPHDAGVMVLLFRFRPRRFPSASAHGFRHRFAVSPHAGLAEQARTSLPERSSSQTTARLFWPHVIAGATRQRFALLQ